jgi:uncharacterized membrane protein YsdA (DUF1294 family)
MAPPAFRDSKLHRVRRALASVGRALASLSPLDYIATAALVAVYAIGTSLDDGPGTNIDFYRSAATVIPTLLIAVAIQGRVLELSRHVSFRRRYRTVLLAIVVFGGETGALMTIAREKTNWAAHLYVYLALMSLGLTMLYLALTGPDRFKKPETRNDETRGSGRT